MKYIFLLIVTITTIVGCKTQPKWSEMSFFEQSLNVIKEKSIKKNEINWVELKRNVLDSLKLSNSNVDLLDTAIVKRANLAVYKAISYTMFLINDRHSIFINPYDTINVKAKAMFQSAPFTVPIISNRIIKNNIAYLKPPGFGFIGDSSDSINHLYILKIRKTLLLLDKKSLSGWIIDLRDNGGGKLSTIPLGIAPLFGDSLIGYALDNKGIYTTLYCSANAFRYGDAVQDTLSYDSHLNNRNKKIAVLVNGQTASSGEFLVTALKCQKQTKIFGNKTKGLSTYCELINFKSSAKLILAITYSCDKEKNKIDGPIVPDVACLDNESLDLAIKWINE